MPAMTGPELYRYLIASGYEIPTILLTVYANDCVRARALKDGVVCYLQKPVDEKHLLGFFDAALQSRESTEDNS
jgi:FixJ family two-component response regulator